MYAAGDSDDDFEDDEAMAMQMQEQYDANFWIEEFKRLKSLKDK